MTVALPPSSRRRQIARPAWTMTKPCTVGGTSSRTTSPSSRNSAGSLPATTRPTPASAPTSASPPPSSLHDECQQVLGGARQGLDDIVHHPRDEIPVVAFTHDADDGLRAGRADHQTALISQPLARRFDCGH